MSLSEESRRKLRQGATFWAALRPWRGAPSDHLIFYRPHRICYPSSFFPTRNYGWCERFNYLLQTSNEMAGKLFPIRKWESVRYLPEKCASPCVCLAVSTNAMKHFILVDWGNKFNRKLLSNLSTAACISVQHCTGSNLLRTLETPPPPFLLDELPHIFSLFN